tara:strand:+ start:716 stop:889 length:174 start_codon:yes stop_codon:yes gene_type:complete
MEKSKIKIDSTKFKFSVYTYIKFVYDSNCDKNSNVKIFTTEEMIECWDDYFNNKKIE